MYCVSKTSLLIIFLATTKSGVIQFRQFLAETHLKKFKTKAGLHSVPPFYMFVLYLVITSKDGQCHFLPRRRL